MAVIGGLPSLAERGRADNVGSLYVRMADRGELLVSEGRRTPDVEGFIEAVIERWAFPARSWPTDTKRGSFTTP